MRRRFLAVLRIAASALFASLAFSFATHGGFRAAVGAIGALLLLGLVLLPLAPLLSFLPFRWAIHLRPWILRVMAASFLAAPALLWTGRLAFAWDYWRLRRFVALDVAPKLERARARHGFYPPTLKGTGVRPSDGPWFLERTSFELGPQGYTLWVMDPGVCGHTCSYRSLDGRWVEESSECWY